MLSEKSKGHMLEYIPMEEAYGRTKATGRTGKEGIQESFYHRRQGQAGGARQTLMHAHAGGVIHFSGPTAPTLHSALCRTGTL